MWHEGRVSNLDLSNMRQTCGQAKITGPTFQSRSELHREAVLNNVYRRNRDEIGINISSVFRKHGWSCPWLIWIRWKSVTAVTVIKFVMLCDIFYSQCDKDDSPIQYLISFRSNTRPDQKKNLRSTSYFVATDCIMHVDLYYSKHYMNRRKNARFFSHWMLL